MEQRRNNISYNRPSRPQQLGECF